MKRRRNKLWLVSPEGFRELRHGCFMNHIQCAAFLGLSVATVRQWESGRTRPNWAAVRLLRLYRLGDGDLGALHDAWAGWTLQGDRLIAPDGRQFHERSMRLWWNTIERARFWSRRFDEGYQAELF